MPKKTFKQKLKATGKAIKKDFKQAKKFVKETAPIVKKGAEDVGRYVGGVEQGLKQRLQVQPIQAEAAQLIPQRPVPRRPNFGNGLPNVLPDLALLGKPRPRRTRPQGTLTLVKLNGKNYYRGQGGILYPIR